MHEPLDPAAPLAEIALSVSGPLRVVLASSRALQRSPWLGERERRLADSAIRSATALAGVVDSIALGAKDAPPPARGLMDVGAIVRDTCGDGPTTTGPVFAVGDDTRLRAALERLRDGLGEHSVEWTSNDGCIVLSLRRATGAPVDVSAVGIFLAARLLAGTGMDLSVRGDRVDISMQVIQAHGTEPGPRWTRGAAAGVAVSRAARR